MRQQNISLLWVEVRRHLESAAPEVRDLIETRFAQSGPIDLDSSLAQSGLRDGSAIVAEFITHNELGLALEHLRYMISAAELPVSAPVLAALDAAEKKMQTPD